MTAAVDTGAQDAEVVIETSAVPPDDWPGLLAMGLGTEYTHTRHWSMSAAAAWPGCRPVWLAARKGRELLGGLGAVNRPAVRTYLRGAVRVGRLESSLEGTNGGPLVRRDLDPALQDRVFMALADALLDRRAPGFMTCTISLNRINEERFGALLLRRGRWVRRDAPTAVVDLEGGIDKVAYERMNRTKRNERNRGFRQGAEVFATANPDLLRQYYPLYEAATAHWGTAPVPLEFLCRLVADPAGRVFFVCVRVEGKVIGGHLNLHYGDRVLAWNGVTDPAYARTHYPATLVFWGDMVEACRRGARWFDLGGSGGVQSLAGFKKYMGAEVEVRGFYTSDTRSMAVLRIMRSVAGRLADGGQPQRWHDRDPESGDGRVVR